MIKWSYNKISNFMSDKYISWTIKYLKRFIFYSNIIQEILFFFNMFTIKNV